MAGSNNPIATTPVPGRSRRSWLARVLRAGPGIALLCALTMPGHAIENTAIADLNGATLDLSRAEVRLRRAGDPVSNLVAEATPERVPVLADDYPVAVFATAEVAAGDTGFDQVLVTAPPGYRDLAVTAFSAGGSVLASACPAPGAGEYCAQVSGRDITILLGEPFVAPAVQLRVSVTADTPDSPGTGDFSLLVDDTGIVSVPPTPAVAGNADGDPDNGNALTVEAFDPLVDALKSEVTVDPPLVLADGTAESRITVVLRDAAGQPVAGRQVLLASDRGILDTLVQPLGPSDAEGIATGFIRSNFAGVATITATDILGDVELADHPEVTFTQGLVLDLSKYADDDEVVVGEVVTYRIEIRNLSDREVIGVRLFDDTPPAFKYLDDSTRLDGAAGPEPLDDSGLVFEIGSVPAQVDGNGNGVADPGEPGYRVLSYRMIVGSGARPGEYENLAQAVDACEQCLISNLARATVEVQLDPVLDLGTIIGKVFEDLDGDGWQDPGEYGIGEAMVVLDDGSYALTDEHGRYHFPAVLPGQRLLKLNTKLLPGVVRVTTQRLPVVSVTEGLMAKANFGVRFVEEERRVGRAGVDGVRVESEGRVEPVRVAGSTRALSVIVNDQLVSLPAGDIELRVATLDHRVEIDGDGLSTQLRFGFAVDSERPVQRWRLDIHDASDRRVFAQQGSGAPGAEIEWDGRRDDGRLIRHGGIYTYQLELEYADGTRVASPRRSFGVDRRHAVALDLRGGAFVTGSHELTGQARELLTQTAFAIRELPDEQIVISGHTDSVGADDANLALSRRRAQAALDYLVETQGLPRDQFVVLGHGESRPVADNASEAGRAQNRRVEIRGELTQIDRTVIRNRQAGAAGVRVNGADVAVGADGRFELLVDDPELRELDIALSTAQARAVQARVVLPGLRIVHPAGGERRVAYREDRPGDPAFADAQAYRSGEGSRVRQRLAGSTEPGNTLELDGERLAVDEQGNFEAWLELAPGRNVHGLVARNAQGFARIANLNVEVTDRDGDGPVVLVETIPNLVLRLPPDDAVLTNPNLLLQGYTDPGNRVRVNGAPVEIAGDGSFGVALQLVEGENRMVAEVVDPEGHTGMIEQRLERSGPPVFLLAFADARISQITTDGNLRAANTNDESELRIDGRVAYYLKGMVAGRYLITSAFDSGQTDFENLFSDLGDTDNRRLITNLDPDTLYPVYGDDSTVVYDAESQGKFYLAVESPTLQARVGNYPLSFDDTELAAFQRTLYGARVAYRSAATTAAGAPRAEAQVFGAQVRQAHVHDELRATGGSLYYLSQLDVIEGSEQIALVVRDRDTGLTLSRMPQRRDLDYTIKYAEGRVLFRRPLASVQRDDRVISDALLAGSPVFVEIDYEARVDALERSSTGARGKFRASDYLSVGATHLNDEQLDGNYELSGVDAELRLGERSRVVAEIASSSGEEGIRNVSLDGGFSYARATPADVGDGTAFKLATELDLGELLGRQADRAKVGAYYKDLDRGFVSNGTMSEQGSRKLGLRFAYRIDEESEVLGRYDRQEIPDTGAEMTQSTVQWNRSGERLALSVEIQDRETTLGDGLASERQTAAAARVRYAWNGKLATSIEHQYTIEGEDNDQTTVGLDVTLSDLLTLDARATTGSRGRAAELGARATLAGSQFYLSERVADEPGGRTMATVLGAETAMGESGKLYSEYQFGRFTDGVRNQTLLGIRRRWELRDGLTLIVSGEHTRIDTPDLTDRYAIAFGLDYANGAGLEASSRNEIRREEGGIERRQWMTSNHLELALRAGFRLLGKYRYSTIEDPQMPDETGGFTEASIGLAYRPVDNDRFNALARYTYLSDDPTLAQDASDAERYESNVFSTDWSYQFAQRLEWVGKQAFKIAEIRAEGMPDIETHTYLSIQRLNLGMVSDVAMGLEYRRLAQDEADDVRAGWLAELMWERLEHLRAGIGYNFTDFSDDENARNDYSSNGWFLRLQGKY